MDQETYWFEGITRYDKSTYQEFAKYHYRHVAPGLPIFLTAAGTMALSWGFIQLFLEPDSWSVWPCIRFFEDRVEYAGQQEQGFYYYHQIVRFRENQGYFFLYLSNNRAMMISKAGMTLGTPDQLRGFLHQKISPQYK